MSELKQRHGCLSAWLIYMVFTNSLIALIYLFGSGFIKKSLPNVPGWAFPVMSLLAIVNVACAVSLFRWKKWGFFSFIITSIVALVLNMAMGLGIKSILFGLVGVGVLYGVLQIGGARKGWSQLE